MTTVSNTSATGTTAAATTSGSRSKLNANFDTFLKMLTTQLQYQDPLKPMDTAEFTNQLVMYSQVEQQLSSNEKLDALIKLQQGQGTNAALGYLGWEVSALSNNLSLQSGSAKFSVEADKPVDSLAISITDSTGRTVRGITLDGNNQTNFNFTWDGKDNNGNVMPPGAYKISLIASDSKGSRISAKTFTSGVVTGINTDTNGNTLLELGAVKITPAEVRSVRAPENPQA
jgi:flagellar basal-body rod modification protein FlgD